MRSSGHDGANPILKLFQLKRQCGSAGQEQVWRIYDAVRAEDAKECSLFVFEKRIAEKLHKPKRKETVSEILRREVRYLERFKHPKLLQIWHPVEECSENLAFATEPVWGCLANFLGNHDRIAGPVPPELKEAFTELEVKHGIYQVNEALKYLHSTQKVIHGNLNLNSIVITKRGCWKLSGLGFVEKSASAHDAYNFTQWTTKASKMAQPDLDFMAPDLQIHGKATQACDVFSLGLVIHAIFNGGQSLLDSKKSPQQYHRRVEELPVNLPKALTQLPHELTDMVEKMLDRDPKHRPSTQLLSMNRYFQDQLLLALEGLTTCEAKTMEQKKEFFSLLMQTMMREQFPKTILFKRVAPLISENVHQATELTPFVLPCLLRAAMHSTQEEFRLHLRQHVLSVLRKCKGAQTTLVLVEHTDVLSEKLEEEEVKSDVLPLVFATLESSSASGQEAALNAFSVLQEHIDEQTLRKLVLPKAKAVFQNSASLSMRVKALACVEQLLERLDKMTIIDEVLPFLLDISFSDPDIYMAVISIYKQMLSDKKFGLTFGLIATRVLPQMIPYTVNPNLRRDDFRTVMEALNMMWSRLENGRAAQMKLEDAEPGEGDQDSSCLMRPPLITMQQPSFDADLNLAGASEKLQSRRRSSSGLQQKEAAGNSGSESSATVRSNPGAGSGDSQKPLGRAAAALGQRSGSASPRRGSATDIYGQSGTGQSNSVPLIVTSPDAGDAAAAQQQEAADDSNRSFTLSIPSVQQRRHSLTNAAAGANFITAGVSEGPFITPPGSKSTSRRPSAQGLVPERLVAAAPVRRSSFNALSDTVLNLFGGSGKPG